MSQPGDMTPAKDCSASIPSMDRELGESRPEVAAWSCSSSRWARWVFAASVIIALLVLAVQVGWYHRAGLMPDMVLDDSYISFRYARNLVRGHGLVYNVNERVEGYTNFLWTLAVAGALASGARPELAAEALAALAAAGTILLLGSLSRGLIQGPLAGPARFLPPVLFAAIGSQARHVVSGMETLLFVFLVFAGFACLFHGGRRSALDHAVARGMGVRAIPDRTAIAAGLLFGLASLTRPEGILYACIGVLCAAWGNRDTPSTTERYFLRLRPPLLLGVALLTVVGPHLAWRRSFYGYWLPNTYYAKVAGPLSERISRGWGTLSRAMEDWDIWPVSGLALLAIPAVRRERFWLWSIGISVATLASFLLVGGDFVLSFGPRLLMPALPFVLLLGAEGLRRTAAWLPGLARFPLTARLFVAIAGSVLVAHALWRPWPTYAGRLGGLATVHHAWHVTGEWLARESDADALVATSAAGIVPYVSDRPVLDMFGLTDEYIAHHAELDPAMPPAHGKSDPIYVLERRPDYIHVINLTSEGIPETARLGWVAGRVAEEYELVAQVKARRGPLVKGQWLFETNGFRPDLHEKGYTTGIFRRIEN